MEQIKIERMAALINEPVMRGEIAGAVLLVGQGEDIAFFEAWGDAQKVPERLPMTRDTLFDIASLTKLTGTWPGIMLLLQEKKLSLDSRLGDILDQPMHPSLRELTIWHLLTHTGGLISGHHPAEFGSTRQERIDGLFSIAPAYVPGQQVRYSDLSFIYLGEVLAHLMGRPLDAVAASIFDELGMKHTGFLPPKDAYCAATEVSDGEVIRGRVHDTTAFQLGGVAGHAGVFSTAEDLARFCAAILPPHRHPMFHPAWLNTAYQNHTAYLNDNRALGWIAYRERREGNVVGHTGFTGTSIWMDTVSGDYVILLTNRVHPTRDNSCLTPIRLAMMKEAFGE